jgi:serine/threonine protein kinase
MNEPDNAETIDLRIADVVFRWLESAEEDRLPTDELIERFPELAPGLAECFRGLERVEHAKLTGSIGGANTSVSGAGDAKFPEIPDFEVLGELGRGGMGVVYEAKQISLDRIVALKVLPFGAVDPRAVKRFLREAETVASLTHPGIVPVYSVGVHGGLNWFAMQRIEGCPLSQWFAVSTFTSRAEALDEVVRVGIEAAEALEHAHQHGVIHRDVKPGNLLVDTTGKVWLTDFGLARRDVDVTATATGAMLGTPRYMSAEQISGFDEEIDARTDIYSLGATLYEMATGRPPFTSESPLELLTQIRRDEPTPPRQVDPTIPRTLELVLLKCLDKEPKRRYPSAAALADDLKAIRDFKPILAKGLPSWLVASRFFGRNKRQINAVAMTAVGTVATLVATALLWQQSEQAKLGQVRIDTPAGLYVASIQRQSSEGKTIRNSPGATVRLAETDQRVVTTPMQQAVSIPAGDYRVRLEGAGAPSQTVDVVVKPKNSTEIGYVDRRESLPQVDIHQKLSVPMDDNALAVLGKVAFEVIDPDSEKKPRFTLPIAQLDAGLIEDATDAKPAKDDDPPLTFAFNAEQEFQGDYTVSHSPFARIERIATKQIDLNQDGQPDFLLTAARHAAIAAVSSDGTVLWKERLPMTFEIAEAKSGYAKDLMPNEAIVGITPVDDLNNDGTPDLVLNAALFEPSGFSRPFIFTLSGRDGSKISVAPLPTIAMRKVGRWPWSGLLRHRRQFNSDDRVHRMIQTHHESMAIRSRAYDMNSQSWGGNSNNSALYVLPPLILEKPNGVYVAITATNQAVHFINVADGTAFSPAIMLAQPILRAPQRVRLPDDKLGFLVLTGIANTSWTKCFLELCVLGEAKPRWSISQDIEAYDLASCAADNAFPMVADLDGDGNDEVLLPTNQDAPFKWPQLQCFSSSGTLQWTGNPVAGLSRLMDQALPCGDIDSDGIVDLAVTGLVQLSAAQASAKTGSVSKEGLRLTIDFLSGKTGVRLGFREEHVAASVQKFQVAEIDYVELSGKELVCSVVYGAKEELKLSSITLTFDLGQFNQTTVARGLTVLQLGDASIKVDNGRWYRRRSGPYANPGDVAVWVAREPKQTRYPGEDLIASWISSTKEPRILLSGPNGAVRCVNPLDDRVIWKSEQLYIYSNPLLVVDRPDGIADLVYTNSLESDSTPGFYNSETGKLRFTIDEPIMDAIRFVALDEQDPDRFIYALASAKTFPFDSPPKQDQGFLLLKIDRIEGQLLWSRSCYKGTNAGNPLRPADPFQVDLNNDRVTDLISGNSKDGRLVIEAIDGRDGQSFWDFPLQLTADEWPWQVPWPMMTLIPTGTQKHLLVVDGVANDDTLFDLKSVRLHDGTELDRLRRRAKFTIRNDARTEDVSLHVIAPEKQDGMVGLTTAFPEEDSLVDPTGRVRPGMAFGMKMLHVDEQTGKFEKVDTGKVPHSTAIFSEVPMLGPPNAIHTADLDGDRVLERIEYRAGGEIKILSGKSDTFVSEFKISASDAQLELHQHASKWYLKVANDNVGHLWYELPSGQLALRFGQGLDSRRIGETGYPRLLSHSKGTMLVGATPEAPICVEVEMKGASTSSLQTNSLPIAMISADADSRYRKAVLALGMYDGKSLADVIRLALLSLGAILIPAGYAYRLFRGRTWSLKAMLLAPAVSILTLVCWRALLSPQSNYLIPNLISGVIASLSVWGVFYLMRNQHWKILGMSLALSMLVATLLMLGAQATLPLRNPGMIGYWTLSAWFISVCAAAGQIMMPLALGMAWSDTRVKRAGSTP